MMRYGICLICDLGHKMYSIIEKYYAYYASKLKAVGFESIKTWRPTLTLPTTYEAGDEGTRLTGGYGGNGGCRSLHRIFRLPASPPHTLPSRFTASTTNLSPDRRATLP